MPHFRSKRSLFITFTQAATKSLTNFFCAPLWAYTLAGARSCEFEENTKSTRVTSTIHPGGMSAPVDIAWQ